MAMILDAFVGRSIDKLLEFMSEQTSMVLGVKDELKKLQRTMVMISGSLESAERKRHADPNINTWVRELKDIMYDADDIIDLCMIEGRRLLEDDTSKSAVRHPSCLFSCFSCIKSRHEIGSKIKVLNDRLKQIAQNRSILPPLEYTEHHVRIPTVPLPVESDIVGIQIEEATESLVESLIKEDNKKYRTLGIVGMGGIGKTTLASHIYNDERIKGNFPIRVWAFVSQEFSETGLLKEIIRGAGGNYGQAETKVELVPYLSSALSKRFFIVLDDVWRKDVRRKDVWEDLLRSPIDSARASGRVVITTRDIHVARNMRAEIHPVDKMDNDSGWKLLCNKVFGYDDEEGNEEIFRLKEIGVQIVEKCDGLPLAINVIAGVLRSKNTSTIEWNRVLKSDAWSMSQLHEKLSRALFLSYENLPSHLKQCFLYCSLFPENYIMHRVDLIRYWVAEGFIQPTPRGMLMEDLAEGYYGELIGRNLLHGDDTRCTMHDLLRSLALFLTCDENIFLGGEQSSNIDPSTKIRRLSMGERVELPDVIKQQKCLRTLMLRRSLMIEIESLERLRFLRIITVKGTRIERLPDRIGDLLHLRHLDLDGTNIKYLPESIGCLINLQILILSNCELLHTLPKAITKLCNLRCLHLGGETRLSHVPKGLGKLKHLNHLEGFVVGHDDRRGTQDDEGCDLEELQSLSQLRFLKIMNLERAQPVGAPVLANTHSLRTLILHHNPPRDAEEAIATQRIDEIYNKLSPQSTDLQRLEIDYFLGTRFPSWMMSPSMYVSFPNLTSIQLYACKSCPQLPPLGLLFQLKFLRIEAAAAIRTIGPEFLGSRASAAGTAFFNLEELEFRSMDNWEEWSFGMVEGVGEERRGASKLLPHLKKLRLLWCPKLRVLPEGLRHAASLQDLEINNADNLIEIDNLPFLTNKLSISESQRLERVSNLPSLKSLIIEGCPRLEHMENLDKLQYLDVETQHLPQCLLELLQNAPAALQNLKKFDLICTLPLLKSFLKDGPNWSIIQRIPQIRIQDYGKSSYIEYTKDPPAFKTNVVESKESVD